MPGWMSELLLTQDYFFPPKQHQKKKYLFWSIAGEEKCPTCHTVVEKLVQEFAMWNKSNCQEWFKSLDVINNVLVHLKS